MSSTINDNRYDGPIRSFSPPVQLSNDLQLELDPNRKVALVTGSASGIGANIAIDLAKAGYYVIVTGRDINRLNKIVGECNNGYSSSASPSHSSGKCMAFLFVADLCSIENISKLIDCIKFNFNRLDILVNNLGYRGCDRDILNEPEDVSFAQETSIQNVHHYNINVPMFLICKCFKEFWKDYKDDVHYSYTKPIIINISSIAGQVVVPLYFYSIAKACLAELTRQLALMSNKTGVLCATISPGPILTEERPHHQAMSRYTLMNRVGSTQEISNLVMHTIEHAELFNGQELTIDGGYVAKQKQPSTWSAPSVVSNSVVNKG